jgi:hypothetical protein
VSQLTLRLPTAPASPLAVAKAFVAATPGATYGAIARHLGVPLDEAVRIWHAPGEERRAAEREAKRAARVGR